MNWTDVAAAADLPDGDVVGRVVDGREIALYRLGDEVFATDATCTHGNASLCGGFVESDGTVECPLHQGRFDIRSGRALCEPLEHDLRTHAVRQEGGRIWLRLDPG
jgi:naphthalene 1,2-dioxygenase system ferredoxin subunit